MKNTHIAIITAVATTAVIIVAGGLAYLFYHQGEKSRDHAMTQFVSESLSAITSTWDPKELESRADPAFTEAVKTSGKSLDGFFNLLGTLGKPKSNIACSRLRYSVITEAAGKFATADFGCKATFEHGPAVIVMQIKQDDLKGPWRITLFRVDSPLFKSAEKNKKSDNKDKPGKDQHDKQ